MAIIYSYPPNNNILSTDIIVCTSTALVGGKPKNQTKSLSIGNLSTYIISSPSNNLNQVLTNGNMSELDAKIGELYLYDGPNADYAKISVQDDLFSVIKATSGTSMFFVDNGYSFTMNNGTANATIINPLTVSRTYTLPDKSGTFALTSDIPTLQQVVNVGNTIVVPITVAKGIDITLANESTVFQNGISVTIPAQTGIYPTYQPAPDAFVANINGQAPGSLVGSVVGFLASTAGDDNVGFFADLTATSGTSRGFETNSFDTHTGDYFIARKYTLGVDSTVFKVANNGDTTAKSFIKTGGTASQFLKADGSVDSTDYLSSVPTLQQVTETGNTTDLPIAIQIEGTAVAFSAYSQGGSGVQGSSEDSVGVYGSSQNGYGGYFTSDNTYSLVADGTAAKPGGGTWDSFSDSRVKENIKPYSKGLAEIILVNPVNYEYNGLANTTKGIEYTGVIAQEIKDIFPETVTIYKAKLNKEDEEDTELYNFNSTALTFALINAVKELKAEIELLKNL